MTLDRIHFRIVWALGKRDLRRYFNNPTGYVFVTLFIFLSAAAAFWRPRFFLNNLANLDQLNQLFPYILLLFVPALTMGLWSEERKQGTDELLLTMPATELELVLGKYVATLGIYTASIVLSLSHVLVLLWLGSPDMGLMAANYLGYWLVGAALIPLGMLASLVTINATMSFILGCVLCTVPIGVDTVAGTFSASLGRALAPVTVAYYFIDFARGIVSVTAVLYFVSLAGWCLYLDVLLLSRRRWPRRPGLAPVWLHQALRTAALVVALGSTVVLAGRAHARLDVTGERMHSLSDATKILVASLPSDRPVIIQAFVSPEVPEPYVQGREDLLNVLREIQARSGGRVLVTIDATEPYSPEARLARERYGINPQVIVDPESGAGGQSVYLGVVLTSGPEEDVIPFLERGLSAEYEIARAIRVITRSGRKRIGVIAGDVRMFGGVNFDSGQSELPWGIVRELRKQYDVVEMTPYSPITEKVDALLVVLPSRLSQSEIDLVLAPIQKGTPALILVDPLPAWDLQLAPAAPMAAKLDPFRRNDPAAQRNYGDYRKMLSDLGVDWVPARVVWDTYNPHPDMPDLPPEAVFVSAGSGSAQAFNPRHAAAAGLQELLMLYPGYLLPQDTDRFTFDPLLQTGRASGTTGFFETTRPTPSGPALSSSVAHQPEGRQLALAAQARAKALGAGAARPSNVIVVADLDFISDYFFAIRSTAPPGVSFDNITFFLNAMDVLTGDESFIALRSHHIRHRTLERVEAQTGRFVAQRSREEQQTEKDARAALDDARSRVKKRVDDIQARTDLDDVAKQIMVNNLEATESRRLQVLGATIEQEKSAELEASRETVEAQIRRIRGAIRTIAVLAPPIPVFVLGVAIFVRRQRREREGARVLRRLRDTHE
ncbi:MAG: ABC transporter [Acidobacteria bacterium]|nr:ABC transporter [Acidobacteriota bacterium]